MTGVDEENAVRSQVLSVVAFCAPGGQGGHQVVGWCCAALVEQPAEVGQHPPGRVVGGLDRGAVGVALAGEAAIERGNRRRKPVTVVERNAKHLSDHRERQGPGEVRDQIHAACV